MSIITTFPGHKFPWYVKLFFWNRHGYEPVHPDCLLRLVSLIEHTGLIGFQNMSSNFNAALGVKSQDFYSIAPQLINEKATTEKQQNEVRSNGTA